MVRMLFAALTGLILLAAPVLADDTKYFKLVHTDSMKVLAITEDSGDAGAKATLAKDEGTEAQQWSLVKDGDYLKIVNRKSGKVLDVNEASRDEGADIIQWDEKGDDNDNQRWSWVGDGKTKRLKSKASSHVLSFVDDKVTQKKSDDKSKGQLWEAIEVMKK